MAQIRKDQRVNLREVVFHNLQRGTLELVLNDGLDGIALEQIARDSDYETQCLDVVRWAEKSGKIYAFCKALSVHPKTEGNIKIQTVVSEILSSVLNVSAGIGTTEGDLRKSMLNRRPFLNRDSLWSTLETFAAGSGLDRILLIGGDEAAGKSYSEYLVGYQANPGGANFVSVKVRHPGQGELTARQISCSIFDRLWPDVRLSRFDDFSQEVRDGGWYGDKLVGRLATLPSPTWLLIDRFNEVDLAQSAVDLLIRLCRAIDTNELQNLWLVLIGVHPAALGVEYESYVTVNVANGPNQEHIEDFVRAFATGNGRNLDETNLDKDIQTLSQTLGATPTHESWRAFHRLLAAHCSAMIGGS